jgi:hypothetical protein
VVYCYWASQEGESVISTIIIITPPVKPPPTNPQRRQDVEVPDNLSIADQLRAAADVLDGEG